VGNSTTCTCIVGHDIKIDRSSFERVEEFKYLGTVLPNENSIQEEIKSSLNQGMFAIIQCRIFCLPVFYPKI
jgi:hypothetical protein